MLRVINISKKSIVINKIKILPQEQYDFDEKTINKATKSRIDSLVRLNLIKLVVIIPELQPQSVSTEPVEALELDNNIEEIEYVNTRRSRKTTK